MSSLSFDNVFPSDPGDRHDHLSHPAPAVQVARLPGSWSDPLQMARLQERATGDASPWVLSATRRAMEFVVAALALVTFAPLMVCAAALVRMGSAGPAFFRQKRMGRNGKEFTLYKFRSMHREPQGGASNGSITVSGDARITPIGGLLRRYKLDELPQFWNVLRGDMGLVGPRPKLPHHEALHMACRPGITGAATLVFRNEEELLSEVPEDELENFYEIFVKPAKAHLDLEYMRTATLMSDLGILWRTATACLFPADGPLDQPAETIAEFQSARATPEKAGSFAIVGSRSTAWLNACATGREQER